MFGRILVVCVGNTCRSPMAEAVLLQRLAGRDISIASAGIAALVGRPADPIARQLMLERGLDISRHRARQLTRDMILASDLVLAMDCSVKGAIEHLVPASLGRVQRIGCFGRFDVPDPVGGGRSEFMRALSFIEDGIEDLERAFWSGS